MFGFQDFFFLTFSIKAESVWYSRGQQLTRSAGTKEKITIKESQQVVFKADIFHYQFNNLLMMNFNPYVNITLHYITMLTLTYNPYVKAVCTCPPPLSKNWYFPASQSFVFL